MAQLIGTQQRTLSDWLRVDGMPGAVHHLARLAVLMGSDVEGLVGADAGTEQLRDADYVYELLLRVVSPAVAKRFLDQRHRQNGQADDEEQA